MKFSAQEEYGMRCLLAIAAKGSGSLTIPEISRAEGLSEPHVAKLLSVLRKEGFINSARGHAGGYSLARPASEINVGHVLEALGGKLFEDDFCERHRGVQAVCSHNVGCALKSLWSTVQGAVDQVLSKITVADLLPPPTTVTFYSDSPARSKS
jgi:Rrf2 family protein